jgi:hypothetical protein
MLGVLLLNALQASRSVLVSLNDDEDRLQQYVDFFPSLALKTNVMHALKGDYYKSPLQGADLSVGCLSWNAKDRSSFLQGISRMIGSAKTMIFFVP